MWPFDWFMEGYKPDGYDEGKNKKRSVVSPRKKNQKHVSWATVITILVFLYFLAMAFGGKGGN